MTQTSSLPSQLSKKPGSQVIPRKCHFRPFLQISLLPLYLSVPWSCGKKPMSALMQKGPCSFIWASTPAHSDLLVCQVVIYTPPLPGWLLPSERPKSRALETRPCPISSHLPSRCLAFKTGAEQETGTQRSEELLALFRHLCQPQSLPGMPREGVAQGPLETEAWDRCKDNRSEASRSFLPSQYSIHCSEMKYLRGCQVIFRSTWPNTAGHGRLCAAAKRPRRTA